MLAQRQNSVLTIPEHQVELYLKNGYDIYTDEGKLVKKAIPFDVGELQVAYAQHIEKIKELEEEIESLREQLGGVEVNVEVKPKKSKKQ